MKSFFRSAITAASLGWSAPLALGQYEPSPMAPPVPPQVEETEPSRGFTAALPVPRPAPTGVTARLAVPVVSHAGGAARLGSGVIPAASPPKPAPVERVQHAIPAEPTGAVLPAPAPPGANDGSERPDYLPVPAEVPQPPSVPAPPEASSPPALPEVPSAPAPARDASAPAAPAEVGATPEATAPFGTDALEAARPEDRAMPHQCAPQDCPTRRLSDAVGGWRFRGWLDGGYVWNTSNPDSKFNGPYNSVDRSAEPMLNQLYAIVERPLPTDGNFGAGFRADALFGYDHYLGQSRGFEVDRDFRQRWNGQYYGLAIPQAYAEFGWEVISLKLGHFYAPIGYEVLPSLGNFFYSHAYSYQFGQPITLWGGLATAQLTRNWQAQAGFTNGWNTLVGRANNLNFVGSLKFTPDSDRWWASFGLITGDNQNNLAGLPFVPGTDGNRTRYSFLLGVTPGGPCGRWEYVFHHFYGWQENGTPQRNFARWYGIDQYLFYRASEKVRLGTRFEWFRDEDGTRVGLNRPANPNNPPLPGNYFSLTAGVNYTPTANVLVRPEIRWDFTSDTARPAFNDGAKNSQLLLACDVIWKF